MLSFSVTTSSPASVVVTGAVSIVTGCLDSTGATTGTGAAAAVNVSLSIGFPASSAIAVSAGTSAAGLPSSESPASLGCVAVPSVVLNSSLLQSTGVFWICLSTPCRCASFSLVRPQISVRGFPSTLPTATASIEPSGSSRHLFGPRGMLVGAVPSEPGTFQSRAFCIAGSRLGRSPHAKLRVPPYFFGMFSTSIYLESVGRVSASERMKILETVMGSNHRLIQLQTVGKNPGAPII
jgi:hypothetical protein